MESRPWRSRDARVTGGAYALLFLLGLMESVIGCFEFGGTAGPVPVAALLFSVALFGTALLGGRGMRSAAGAFAPAAGWFLASLVLSLPTGGGSVIITNTSAGLWYIYGCAVMAVIAIVVAYTLWSRPGAGRQ